MTRLPAAGPGRSRWLLVVAATALAWAAGVGGAGPATAHAALESTTPAAGAQVSQPPAEVSLRFGESVGVAAGAVEVLDARGVRVDAGPVQHPGSDDRAVAVALRPGLPTGSYLVLWHVVSADSHPVGGSFTFGYGVAAGAAPAPPAGDPVLAGLHVTAWYASLTGTVGVIGSSAFLLLIWPAGFRVRRCRRLLVTSWATCLAGTVALLVLEGPYGLSLGLADALDPGLLGVTVGTIYGKLLVLRLVALLAAALVWRGARGGGALPGRLDVAGPAVLVAESFSFGGHAGQGDLVPLAATADALHLAAASVWLGGLAVLAVSLWRPPEPPGDELAALAVALPRWSRLAMTAVSVLVVTGTYQAWRETGSLDALQATGYGRLLLAKAAALVVLLVVADRGRRWALRHREAPNPGAPSDEPAGAGSPETAGTRTALATAASIAAPAPWRGLRNGVLVEVALGLAVLAVTVALVNTEPARQAYLPGVDVVLTGTDTEGSTIAVRLLVAPAVAGFETFTVQPTPLQPTALQPSSAAGDAPAVRSASGELSAPELGLGPITFTLSPGPGGRLTATGIAVPVPGRWTLVLQLRTDSFTDYTATTTYTAR